jgi:hypothetical protein
MAKSKVNEWLEHDKLVLLEGWARSGLTNEQIAKNIGISPKTLYEWQNKHCDILNTLKKGKEVVDFEVENALLKRALGYTVELKKQKVTKYGDVVNVIEEMHIPPDVTAQIYWLKNRKPQEWREKREQAEDEKDIKTAKELVFKIKECANNGARDN